MSSSEAKAIGDVSITILPVASVSLGAYRSGQPRSRIVGTRTSAGIAWTLGLVSFMGLLLFAAVATGVGCVVFSLLTGSPPLVAAIFLCAIFTGFPVYVGHLILPLVVSKLRRRAFEWDGLVLTVDGKRHARSALARFEASESESDEGARWIVRARLEDGATYDVVSDVRAAAEARWLVALLEHPERRVDDLRS